MKKLAIALLSLTLISNSACADSSDVVATYSGGKVTSQQVMDQFKMVLEKQPESKGKKFTDLDKTVQESLVKNYINMKLLEQEANNLGITKTTQFKEKMKNAENYLVQQELFELKTKDAISPEAVNAEYDRLVKMIKGQKEIKVSHILVESEEQAQEIKKKAVNGISFETLANQYTKDEASKVQGGSIGYITKGRLVPEFEEKAFSMKKNEISNPVKTNFGWHVIKVYDIRDITIPQKEQIENELKNRLANEAVRQYIEQLEKSANIEMKI